jgi:hypothetical protein
MEVLRERSQGHNGFEEPWRDGLRPVRGLGSSSRAGDVSVLTEAREHPEAESRASQENRRIICAFASRLPRPEVPQEPQDGVSGSTGSREVSSEKVPTLCGRASVG